MKFALQIETTKNVPAEKVLTFNSFQTSTIFLLLSTFLSRVKNLVANLIQKFWVELKGFLTICGRAFCGFSVCRLLLLELANSRRLSAQTVVHAKVLLQVKAPENKNRFEIKPYLRKKMYSYLTIVFIFLLLNNLLSLRTRFFRIKMKQVSCKQIIQLSLIDFH